MPEEPEDFRDAIAGVTCEVILNHRSELMTALEKEVDSVEMLWLVRRWVYEDMSDVVPAPQ